MLRLPGYRLSEERPARGALACYGGRRLDDGVAVEVLAAPAGSAEAARLTSEHAIAGQLPTEAIAEVLACENLGGQVVLVRADTGLGRLAERLAGAALPLLDALRIGCAAARALAMLHAQRVVHGALCPEHLLVDRAGRQVRLTGLGMALRLASGDGLECAPAAVEHPAYMAPEQTGRTDGRLGPASDLYALGVILFQMLTGELPFRVGDPMEWFHCHIARQPLAAIALDSTLPAPVSAIVERLLAKAPESRYHSAGGLAADLDECTRRVQSGAGWAGFLPGARDRAAILEIPARLFGRDTDRTSLIEACQAAIDGDPRLLLVGGPAGIGKSALVQELRPLIAGAGGRFLHGKFDQQHRGTPYASLLQALRELVNQLLAEPEAQLGYWRGKLRETLGSNGGLLVDTIRATELILGPQRPLPELPPAESRIRYQRTLRDFIRTFAEPGRPLAIFLDDLQWADPASLELLPLLLSDHGRRPLLIVGAYRDDELDAGHPLAGGIDRMDAAGVPVTRIVLAPMPAGAVATMVAETLRRPDAQALGMLIADRTDGNPLFVRQFLLGLCDQGLLVGDAETGRWSWDLERIASAELADDVAELVARRQRRLGEDSARVLGIGAVIGNRFELELVAAVAGCPVEAIAVALSEAEREGLIVAAEPGQVRFAHDRIQQVAYQSLADAQRRSLHLAAGRSLRERFAADAERVFDIVNQFRHALDEVADPGERAALSELFTQAGGRAKAAAAADSALAYLGTAAALAPADLWQSAPAQAMRLYLGLAECEFICGRLEAAERRFAELLEHAREPRDIARIHVLRMHLMMSRNRADEAVATACSGLRRLGVAIDANPRKADLLAELARVAWRMKGRRIEDLATLPAMSDPLQKAVMTIYMNLTVAAYFVNRELLALVAIRMVGQSIRYGNAGASAYAYVNFGMVIGGGFGRYRDAFRFGELGRRLGEASGDTRYEGLTLAMCGIFTGAWGQPLATSIEQLQRAWRLMLDCGNLMMANYAAIANVFARDGRGDPLPLLDAEAARGLAFVRRIRFDDSAHYFRSLQRKIACLRGETVAPGCFDGAGYDEAAQLAALDASTERTALAWHRVNRLEVACRFGDLATAKQEADALRALDATSMAQLYVPRQLFYAGLVESALAARASGPPRRSHRAQAQRYARRLEAFARNAPKNFGHLVLLLDAERALLGRNPDAALPRYRAALSAATDSGCRHDRALVCERLGEFLLARGLDGGALAYLRDAADGYRQWGADALAQAIERRHARRLGGRDADAARPELAEVIKAAQALSGEVEFAGLRRRLMESLAVHAGAARVVLLLRREERLWAEEEWQADGVAAQAGPGPLETRGDLAHSVVQYAARTMSEVVIEEALRDPAFAADPYLAAGGQKSLLCLPIVRHAQMLGLLYMENPLLRGAFHSERLRVLRVLTGQLAISIENALLYERLRGALDKLEQANRELEDKVAERTRALSEEIDERKRIELALRAATDAAEAANRAKSAFLANMSHEIRTPMNAIIGLSQLALRTELTPRQFGYLKKIGSAAEMLLGLISDILDMAKIEAGKMTLERVPFSLDETLERIADTMEMAAHEKGLEFVVNRPPDVPCRLIGDPLRLGQVLLNLTSNAIKFTSRGEVLVSTERVHYDEWANQIVLRFAVRDTGVGLSAEQLGKLFRPFAQADMSTTRTHGGTGLGLSIVKQLVERMDGEVSVDSAPGLGSTFSFTARFAVAPPERQAEPSSPDYARLRVLVVDDNLSAREALRHLLEAAGCEVSEAPDGPAAIATLREAAARDAPLQLVLMDWSMPGMDGIEATLRIKSDDSIPARPVVVMVTAYSREEVSARAERARAAVDAYLMKPVRSGVLFDTIGRIFDRDAPAKRVPQPALRPVAGGEALAGCRVLVVEDNEYNQLVARELLESAGARVDIAGNGRVGVDLATSADPPYALVLMDVQMPELDGWDATRELRAHPAGRDLPIVGMTAYTMAEDIERCRAAGMDEVVTKPIRIDHLLSLLAGRVAPRVLPGRLEPEPRAVFDAGTALSNLAGSRELLARGIHAFLKDERDCAERVERLLGEGAFELAAKAVHSTRGVAATLGLERIVDCAAALERQLRTAQPALDMELLQCFRAELEAGSAALEGVPLEAPAAPIELSQDDFSALLAELSTPLAANDMRALTIARRLHAAARTAPQSRLAEALLGDLERLDFKGARRRLSEALPA